MENDTHDTGVIGSSGPLESEFVEMGYLSRNADAEARPERGDQRQRRDLPGRHPIGKVVDSQSVDYGLRVAARVKLAANLDALERGVGDGAMNWLNTVFILGAAFLAVFWQAAFRGVRHVLGAQVDLLPPLMVYASLERQPDHRRRCSPFWAGFGSTRSRPTRWA